MNLTALVAAAGFWSYALVFGVTAGETSAFIGVVLPSETVVLFAAALSSRGLLNPYLLALAVIAGGIIGDSTGYWLGRLFGKRLDQPKERRRIKPGGRVERATGYLRRHGGPAVFTGRFIGFVRSFVPFTAGAARMPYRRFLGYSAAASVIWGSLNITAGYFLGASASGLLHTAGIAGAVALAAAVLITLGALGWRRRRRLARDEAGQEPRSMAAPGPGPAETDEPTDAGEPGGPVSPRGPGGPAGSGGSAGSTGPAGPDEESAGDRALAAHGATRKHA
ncbi:DedA family protein [Kitasatospora viridis]|uniref:Membrane protein DedA with SNARE-associated domain n=1 Tax=Kitasatospora viridis TaxID=281105 RepID=A0A561TTS5_9ACTN|nr:DedA family protein [Kitasatospora viridis]TWF90510.1 membrane protein DedA with SNARE-associated domain [Kitasatospora viridis]